MFSGIKVLSFGLRVDKPHMFFLLVLTWAEVLGSWSTKNQHICNLGFDFVFGALVTVYILGKRIL